MKVQLLYGRNGLKVDFPTPVDVLEPDYLAGLENGNESIRFALNNPFNSAPLKDRVQIGNKVVIAHSDITRATPNRQILPILINELESAGVRSEDIKILNALGTHRRQTEGELRELLGDWIFDHYHCIQHDAFDDDQLVSLGTTSFGNPVRVNRTLIEADFKILTGFIEPHFFAGFSGGPKSVLPALAGAESVLTNHSWKMIANPNATWGITYGNPIWEEMLEIALKVNPSFLLNVAMNPQKQITGVFAGDLTSAHLAGCEFVKNNAMVAVEKPYDIVITTNSGYPLDQNLYQCVKGMSAANQVLREGGAILMAAECEDGLPDHGRYRELLIQGGSPQGILEMLRQPGFTAQDQWQVQIQAIIQSRVDVFVYSTGLTESQIITALLRPVKDIAAIIPDLIKKYGNRICVIPDGPLVVPYLVIH
jgi:nickel-dependent lactate racemase